MPPKAIASRSPADITPRGTIRVSATRTEGPNKGEKVDFSVTCRLDSAVEINYFRNGGILQTVLRKLLNDSRKPVAASV